MSKQNKESINDKICIDNVDIDNLSIEDIDKEMDLFYIDEEKFEDIKVPDDMDILISTAIDKAQQDMKMEKIRKRILPIAASVSIILSAGIYNPVFAHKLPVVEKVLEDINDILKIDEIASLTKIDQVIAKATLDKEGKIIFIKAPKYELNKNTNDLDEKIENKNEGEDEVDKEETKFSENTNEVNEVNEETEENEVIGVPESDVSSPLSEYESIQLIHQMSNVIINPIDGRKVGYTEITPKTIDIAKEGLKFIQDEGAKSYLANQLANWENGKFDNAVNVHNFVWNMLDGDVGKAISIDHNEVNKIKNKYFK